MKVLAHAHTTYSADGELTVPELADLARRRGFDAVLLSDHFEHLTAESFGRLVAECRSVRSCLMVPGYERSWRGYHVLALGVLQWFDDPTPAGWAARVKQAGGFVAIAHPGRYRHDIPPDLLEVCDAVEVWNSKRGYDGPVGPHPAALRLLGAGRRPICGQDLHGVRHASNVALETHGSTADPQCILDDLRQGRYLMTNGVYALDGEMSRSARSALTLFHAIRTPAIAVAGKVLKLVRLARRGLKPS